MNDGQLLEIDHTLVSIDPEKQDSACLEGQQSNYYQAIRELKDVHERITTIKTRINSLARNYKKSMKHLTITNKEEPKKANSFHQDFLTPKQQRQNKEKPKIQAELRRKIIDSKKMQIFKRIDRARRITTQDKFRTHDQVRQQSLENLRKIEKSRRTLFVQKQIRHDELYSNEKQHRRLMKDLEERKLKQKKEFLSLQTKQVYKKIQEKQRELNSVEHQFGIYEKLMKSAILKKERKLKKKWSLRKNLPTLNYLNIPSNVQIPPQSARFYGTIS